MRYVSIRVPVVLTMLFSLVGCTGPQEQGISSLLIGAEDLHIEYWEWTAKDEVTYWRVPVDITDLLSRIGNATPFEEGEFFWFNGMHKGTFQKNGEEFSIKIGDGKRADNPFKITIQKWGHLEREHDFKLVGSEASDVSKWFYAFLKTESMKSEPRVEKR